MTDPTPLPRKPTCACADCQQTRDEVRTMMLEFRRGLQIISAAIDSQYGESRRERERREKEERRAA